MKILVVCQHYWPEPFPLTDICEDLVKRGHEVHIITDVPNYPMGYIYDGYKKGKNRKQTRNGVKITRTFTIGRRNNLIFRFLNYFSFAISSTLYAKGLKEEYDVVFTNQTSPILMVNAAMTYAKKHKKKTVLYCMDLWPASLAAGGVGQGSPIYKVFHKISDYLYKKADRILITSQMFREYFRNEFGIDDSVISYLPQYANAGFEATAETDYTDKKTTSLMFAGNVGAAQSIPTILGAAKLLKNKEDITWHIVGDGSELENLKASAEKDGLSNVIFHGRHPIEKMPEFYSMADAMLVTLTKDPFISLTLPAKVQSYMAAGKPIIAAADGEIPIVLEKSGCVFSAPAEDAKGLANEVTEFINHKDKKALSQAAKKYYKENFTQELFMDKLESELLAHCK